MNSIRITLEAAIVVEEILHSFADRMGLPDAVGDNEEMAIALNMQPGQGHMVRRDWLEREIDSYFDDAVTGVRVDSTNSSFIW